MGFIVYDSQVGEHNWGGPHCICDMDFADLFYGVQWQLWSTLVSLLFMNTYNASKD